MQSSHIIEGRRKVRNNNTETDTIIDNTKKIDIITFNYMNFILGAGCTTKHLSQNKM